MKTGLLATARAALRHFRCKLSAIDGDDPVLISSDSVTSQSGNVVHISNVTKNSAAR